MPKLTQPRMYGRNGKYMWKMPAPKPLPEGYVLGTTVVVNGHRGQIWSEAGPRSWWVACEDGQFRTLYSCAEHEWPPVEVAS